MNERPNLKSVALPVHEIIKVKVKSTMPLRGVGGVLISLSVAVERTCRGINHYSL